MTIGLVSRYDEDEGINRSKKKKKTKKKTQIIPNVYMKEAAGSKA